MKRVIRSNTSAKRLFATHEVFNQSRPFVNVDLLQSDVTLMSCLKSMNGGHPIDFELLSKFGKLSGSPELFEASDLAEKNRPTLRQFDNYGRRIDVAEYHPTYHQLMSHGLSHGCAAYGFREAKPGSQITRAALMYMENQVEAGHCCPIVMTAAGIPVLQKVAHVHPWLKLFVEKIFAQQYDPRNLPIDQKTGVTLGMSMTEKQGGSDVRANTTLATPVESGKTGIGAAYSLVGHKWFTSAPMCDGFLTLAKTPGHDTPSCFLVPRWLPDGNRNTGFKVMRLKEKAADRANASSEIEYDHAWAMLIGEEGKGVRTIIEMVQATRLDCTLGSAGGARRALQLALNHTNTRNVFGKKLIDQPLMQNLLTDLCIEAEANTIMSMRMASAFDAYYNKDYHLVNAVNLEQAQQFFRIGVSISKYYVTKRLPQFTFECLEIMGGNGFVEDFPMAKLFRHSPLNSVWEGSGNVIALDILRGASALPAYFAELSLTKGQDAQLDRYVQQLQGTIKNITSIGDAQQQRLARNLADRLAMALQASLLIRFGDAEVAKAFIATRLSPSVEFGSNYGAAVAYDEQVSAHILTRNMPVFLNQ